MSMTERLVAISEEDFHKLINNPELTDGFLFPEDDDFEGVGEKCIDIDKTWNIIHFLLSGMVEVGVDTYKPENSVIIGGEEIGSELVYGPACIIDKEDVKIIYDYLNQLPKAFIRNEFDAKKIVENEVYPYAGSYDVDDLEAEAENEIKYITQVFEKLIAFYKFAAENNFSIIQVIE